MICRPVAVNDKLKQINCQPTCSANDKLNKVIYSKAEMEKMVLVISLQPDSE